MVFPSGMCTASTYRFAEPTGLDAVRFVPRYFVYVALLAWVAVSVGLLRSVAARFRNAC